MNDIHTIMQICLYKSGELYGQVMCKVGDNNFSLFYTLIYFSGNSRKNFKSYIPERLLAVTKS